MTLPTVIPEELPDPEPEQHSRVSRRRLFLLAAGLLVGTAGAFRLMQGFGGFRINEVESSTPVFDPATFRLTVDGAVGNPLSFSMDQLRSLPVANQVSDFHCVEGWGVNNVRWQGVRLQTLIDLARPQSVGYITFHSLDGVYKDSLSLDEAMYPDVMLAYLMNDQPLSPRHGLPLRLIVPHMYGYKGPKWLTRVEFAADQATGYWEERGWDIEGWIH